jgi:hypothetical protein
VPERTDCNAGSLAISPEAERSEHAVLPAPGTRGSIGRAFQARLVPVCAPDFRPGAGRNSYLCQVLAVLCR